MQGFGVPIDEKVRVSHPEGVSFYLTADHAQCDFLMIQAKFMFCGLHLFALLRKHEKTAVGLLQDLTWQLNANCSVRTA